MVNLRFDEFQELSHFEDPVPDVLGDGSVHEQVPAFSRGKSCGFQELFSSTNRLTDLICLSKSHTHTYIYIYTSVLSTFMSVFLVMPNHFFPSIIELCSIYHPPVDRCFSIHGIMFPKLGPAKSPADGKKLQILTYFNCKCSPKPIHQIPTF